MGFWDFITDCLDAIRKSEDLSAECEDLAVDRHDISLNTEKNNEINLLL